MGASLSHLTPSKPPSHAKKDSWTDALHMTRKNLLTHFGHSTTIPDDTIPPDNIFTPIQPDHILPQIPIGRHHPVPRKGVEDDDLRTLHTNKFYANAFLGQQNQPVWTHPYSVWWGRGWEEDGVVRSMGLNVGHVEEGDLGFEEGDPAKVYVNPRKQCIVLSARELGQQTLLTTDTHLPFSVNVNLHSGLQGEQPKMTFPLVQGMSFVTAGYRDATPIIQTGGKGFVEFGPPVLMGRTVKYRVKDLDGRDWVIYINPVPDVDYDATRFVRIDTNTILGPPGFKGTIQVAKNPLGAEGEALYDRACGAFVCEARITATVDDSRGVYSLSYTKIGTSPLLIFALPHHIQSLDPELKKQVTRLQLRTTTKGTATAIWAEKLTFIEPNLPVTMSFGPWTPNSTTSKVRYPPEVLAFISAVAERDLRRAMAEATPQDSMYYAGKSLAKFATIVWVTKDVLSNTALATAGLDKLKSEFARYVANQQRFPLYYDDSWKGVVSSAGFADPGADFGNTFYNDHHFHYGYFVYCAAVIGYLDPEWLAAGDNRAWTNMLVKDFAESEYRGRDYPFSRSFDWWHGHSWAKGVFESADGKDQESTSEDGFASFAVKMWGKVVGDVNMEKRGNLMLAIQARSFNSYFYLQSTNKNHPSRFIQNKVTGILFENKADYATYFGTAPSLIHGIHMVPINPATSYLRPRAFVKEEWDRLFSDLGLGRGLRADVDGGWRGILYANLALIDAKASYAFFRDGVKGFWDDAWIDGGASRTWYLVWAAGMGEFAKRGLL
ncbi:glycoside hydrolase family 81 protein [Dothidotthia symphoricarpi CBS 119687]|uniref:glucan endo-1,3-beta-D-glucosidase n=1 Tax=Dothidotthia symphoricarpi CBS 119687 TaxID=1392245 RepID=A0A6A6AFK0_9PLEO|nr:glycoside hydrolase family 81 protein [Dothidotthia symphoricarpi CBS 119687]KAF2130336.1 glycoside hydrolase family 81 protein [Dothidotthia symphoricarpi CBS 119687]